MSRLLVVATALVGAGYAYLALSLGTGPWSRLALLAPFFFIWVVPVHYWSRDRDEHESLLDHAVHQASYLSMAWVSFALVLTLARDALLVLTLPAAFAPAHALVAEAGVPVVLAGSLLALGLGALTALRGPRIVRVDVAVAGLHPDLDGFRIVQISDLHVGRTIRRAYVEHTVERARSLAPDLVALTGDIVDGPVERLAPHVASLAQLENAFFILGNHDCYSGAERWIAHFRSMGMRVLLNEHTVVRKGAARLLIGGVVDPAYARLRPDIALPGSESDYKLLLAHNPRLAPLGARAGFDLQLSGHTHAGQFFPWTLAVRLVHAPHVAGLSREGAMQVYVSAGTGTWGPPVRFGTSPELTLLTLRRS
jgi:predicted MPP superfamily phosphohydrolase